MTGGKFHRFKEKVKNKMERATISPELHGFTEEEIQPLVPVPKLFSLGGLNIYIYRQVSTSTNGNGGIITLKIMKSLGKEMNGKAKPNV